MISRPLPARREAILACAFAAVTAALCAALLGAAALVPAPAAVLPLVILVSVGLPMIAAYDLSPSLAALRRPRRRAGPLDERACRALRREIDALPETQHPLEG